MGREHEVWKKISDHFRSIVPPDTFELWIAPVKPSSLESGCLVLDVPNHFHAQWLEKNLKKRMVEILDSSSDVVDMLFQWKESPVPRDAPNYPALPTTLPAHPKESGGVGLFRHNYTFDRFVVGPTNRFAYASSMAVAKNPGKQFNPLFVYGNTGLGKTHLLHAIQSLMLSLSPGTKVIYINSETFVNEFIDALKNRLIDNYRNRYRSAVCLLIDDIQFLVGKEQSEQEFFHTFNTLFDTSRQVVITSDRPPKELQPIESRLISRFEWGVVADIKPPDFETRLAILRKKVELEGISIPDNILQHLAQNIRSNIRALEGSLKSLIAFSCLVGSPVTLEVVDQILQQLKKDSPEESGLSPSITQIQEVVAKNYKMSISDLKDKGRSASKVLPRQIGMYLSRTMTNNSLDEIGRSFGGRDHSTIVHAFNKIQSLVRTDPYLSTHINKLEREVRSFVES